MPLHAQHVARAAPADRLDDVVGHRECFDDHAAPELVHRLVMDRVDDGVGAAGIELRELGTGHELQRMEVALVFCDVPMVECAGYLRTDVLVQRAAERDVDQLAATADAEHRLALADERLEQLDLVAIAHGVTRPGRIARLFAVRRRRDVRAALQHEAVERLRVVIQAHVAALDHPLAFDRRDHHHEHVLRHHPVRD